MIVWLLAYLILFAGYGYFFYHLHRLQNIRKRNRFQQVIEMTESKDVDVQDVVSEKVEKSV